MFYFMSKRHFVNNFDKQTRNMDSRHFPLTCRACLMRSSITTSLYYFTEEIRTIFENCTTIKVTDDDSLPMQICFQCLEKCEQWARFADRCLSNDQKLRGISAELVEVEYDQEAENKQGDEGASDFDIVEEIIMTEEVEEEEEETVVFGPAISIECIKDETDVAEEADMKGQIVKEVDEDQATVCPICNEEMDNYYKQHIKDHYKASVENQCLVCGKTFPIRYNVHRHTYSHIAFRRVKCPHCEKMFENEAAVDKHVQSAHVAKEKKTHTCSLCEKTFASASNLNAHLQTHSAERPHVCGICGMSFKLAENMKTHVWKHQAEKAHKCPQCDRCFYQASELNNHMKRHDPKQKNIPCPYCDKTFYNNSNLNDHLKVHTGERPYVCDVCGKSFQRNRLLEDHLLIHTGAKPFGCEVCERKFRKKDTLKTHMKTHGLRGKALRS